MSQGFKANPGLKFANAFSVLVVQYTTAGSQRLLEEMARRVRARPDMMKQRQRIVEHPFGTIKRAMNQGYFLTRGLKKVGAEMSLTVLSYNIKRAINIIGVKKMIEAVT